MSSRKRSERRPRHRSPPCLVRLPRDLYDSYPRVRRRSSRPRKTGRPVGLIEGRSPRRGRKVHPVSLKLEGLSPEDLVNHQSLVRRLPRRLDTSRNAGLARDSRDHNGSSWLLQAAACARLNLKDDRALTTLRHQFRTATIRAQITYDGTFPLELTLPILIATASSMSTCWPPLRLLSTRFESVWTQAAGRPRIRVAFARLYPFIANRRSWPYKADAAFFTELPLRRPALLFAARAYSRPEYADTWRTLPADTSNPELDRTFPIRQPLLWVTGPRPWSEVRKVTLVRKNPTKKHPPFGCANSSHINTNQDGG